MRLVIHCALAATLLPAAAAATRVAVPPGVAPLLDAGADQIVSRTEVPSPAQKVGEVRLIRRGGADVVQTLLYTKILRRVVAEIRGKELVHWPDGSEGHADAIRYVEALEQAREQIWARVPKFERRDDRRQRLLIEFAASDAAQVVTIGTFDMEEAGGLVRVTGREVLSLLPLSRSYVLHNMWLIAADSFDAEGGALERLLGPLERVRAAGPGGSKATGAATRPASPR